MSDETTASVRSLVQTPASKQSPGLLILFSEGSTSRVAVPLVAPVLLGRSDDCDLAIDDPGLSRKHATIERIDGRVMIVDHDSHNGTSVNGERRLGQTPLEFGDILRCGNTLLLLVADIASYSDWPDSADVPPLLGGPQIDDVRRRIAAVASSGLPVIIGGESGCGKELVAREVHMASERAGAFVPLNCAAIPEALFEAEIFGAVKGAFTGATADRQGLMRAANGGTLFLDEIGELPPSLQAKLLRAVEHQEVRPLGGTDAISVDFRLIVATNRDLAVEVAGGRFRADLYHRLSGVTLTVPPLRERREDVALLALRELEGDAPLATASFVEYLLDYRWPGNVRELHQVVNEALVNARAEGAEKLAVAHLRALSDSPELSEGEQIRHALKRCHGNVARTAAELRLSRGKLYARMREHGIDPEPFRS